MEHLLYTLTVSDCNSSINFLLDTVSPGHQADPAIKPRLFLGLKYHDLW